MKLQALGDGTVAVGIGRLVSRDPLKGREFPGIVFGFGALTWASCAPHKGIALIKPQQKTHIMMINRPQLPTDWPGYNKRVASANRCRSLTILKSSDCTCEVCMFTLHIFTRPCAKGFTASDMGNCFDNEIQRLVYWTRMPNHIGVLDCPSPDRMKHVG